MEYIQNILINILIICVWHRSWYMSCFQENLFGNRTDISRCDGLFYKNTYSFWNTGIDNVHFAKRHNKTGLILTVIKFSSSCLCESPWSFGQGYPRIRSPVLQLPMTIKFLQPEHLLVHVVNGFAILHLQMILVFSHSCSSSLHHAPPAFLLLFSLWNRLPF